MASIIGPFLPKDFTIGKQMGSRSWEIKHSSNDQKEYDGCLDSLDALANLRKLTFPLQKTQALFQAEQCHGRLVESARAHPKVQRPGQTSQHSSTLRGRRHRKAHSYSERVLPSNLSEACRQFSSIFTYLLEIERTAISIASSSTFDTAARLTTRSRSFSGPFSCSTPLISSTGTSSSTGG